jgi:MFS family permease
MLTLYKIGGAFVDKVNWHWDFWLNLIISAISFIIILVFLKKPKDASESTLVEKLKRLDYLGTIFSISLVTCILLALNFGPIYG